MTILTKQERRRDRRRARRQARRDANRTLSIGTKIANRIAPELFGEEPLGRLDASKYTDYLNESVKSYGSILSDYNKGVGGVLSRRESGLEGLLAPENTALRERTLSAVDRAGSRELDNLSRAQAGAGGGAASNFAQRRAIERDISTNRGAAEQEILMANIAEKNRRLSEYENLIKDRFTVNQTGAAYLDSLKGRGSDISLAVDQYNQNQAATEIASKIAAKNAGIGLFKDSKDEINQQNELDRLLAYLKENEADKFAQIRGLLG